MKNLKIVPFAVAIALVGFTSCADEKKENNVFEENNLQTKTEVTQDEAKTVHEVNQMEAKRMANMVDENVFTEYKSSGTITSWKAFADLHTGMTSLAGKEYATSKKMAGNLGSNVKLGEKLYL
ncbi:hypothetical protein ES677_14225 [Bizionia gelidisalsuginis]|uniref:Uncharacterized protein n=1 Tax=Bizionia gelidisalsuginis TaxID=291188 RepID=A0ABY3M771_9FLAO|nr:hypothetical protein [Bizionia gelidisalsuginis]TYC08465.1 hypothetical protein ES677_14225 [Bizionia gelidisalsuginis]